MKMRSKAFALMIVFMLIQSSFIFCLMGPSIKASQHLPVCIPVGPSGMYLTIQEGINAAQDGDIVIVESDHTYFENVIVNKSIILLGQNKLTTIIDGSGSGSVVTLVVDHVNMSNFTIINSGISDPDDAGIKLYSSNYSNITDNIIYENYYGILSYYSSDNNFSNNSVFLNSYSGVGISAYSENNTFFSNDIYENDGEGISFYLSANNTLSSNNISFNVYSGIQLEHSDNLTITSNTIYNNTGMGIYNINSWDNTISSNIIYNNSYGIYVDTTESCTITLNSIYNNTFDGIFGNHLGYSSIFSNDIYGNSLDGIDLDRCDGLNVYDNFIFNNSLAGINISYSNNNNITLNQIYNNSYNGIYIAFSSLNIVQSNYIYNNLYDGMYIGDSSAITISSNVIYNNSAGIWFGISSNSNVTSNHVYNCLYGIRLDRTSYINMNLNHFYNNSQYGIYLDAGAENTTITSNFVQDNSWCGVLLSQFAYPHNKNNTIYNNYFENIVNGYAGGNDENTHWNISKITGTNIVGGEWLGGNYWSDYSGNDTNHDSIGDTLLPYDGGIITDGADYLPLVISPDIVSVTPTNGATNVPVSTDIVVTFSKSMNQITVEDNFTISYPLLGIDYEWSNDNTTLTANPMVSNLQYETTYTVRIDWNATDEDGNVMTANYSWSFTTQQQSSGGPGGEEPPSNNAPTAEAGGPYSGYVNQSIRFDGTGSSDPDDDNLTYHWVFGDGRTGTGETPTHTYSRTGNFTVVLTVSDGELNDTDTTIATVKKLPDGTSPPVANAGGPYRGLTYQSIVFDASNSYDPDGSIISYSWSFGDGTTGSDTLLKHRYNQSGVYNVTLIVTDDDGFTDSDKTTAIIILDSDGDGLSDATEIDLGLNPHNTSDIQEIKIEGQTYYLLDSNKDGVLDTFFDTTTHICTPLTIGTDGQTLIDSDGDGKANYILNLATGEVLIYQQKPADDLLQLMVIIGIAAGSIVTIVLGYWIYTDQQRLKKDTKESKTVNENQTHMNEVEHLAQQEIEAFTFNKKRD